MPNITAEGTITLNDDRAQVLHDIAQAALLEQPALVVTGTLEWVVGPGATIVKVTCDTTGTTTSDPAVLVEQIVASLRGDVPEPVPVIVPVPDASASAAPDVPHDAV